MRNGSARERLSSQDGFTLIELLITVVVVILALVGYVAANTAIQQKGDERFERSVAMQDANQVIEQMRSAAATGAFPDNVTDAFPEGTELPGFENLQGQEVSVDYADPAANPLDVTVTVRWLENGRRQTRADLRTLITQRTAS